MNQINILLQIMRTRRKATGLSQEVVAKRIGISKSSFCEIECGKTGFTIERWVQWCAALRISPSDVLRKWEGSQEYEEIDKTRRDEYKKIIDDMIKFGFGIELTSLINFFKIITGQERDRQEKERTKKQLNQWIKMRKHE